MPVTYRQYQEAEQTLENINKSKAAIMQSVDSNTNGYNIAAWKYDEAKGFINDVIAGLFHEERLEAQEIVDLYNNEETRTHNRMESTYAV